MYGNSNPNHQVHVKNHIEDPQNRFHVVQIWFTHAWRFHSDMIWNPKLVFPHAIDGEPTMPHYFLFFTLPSIIIHGAISIEVNTGINSRIEILDIADKKLLVVTSIMTNHHWANCKILIIDIYLWNIKCWNEQQIVTWRVIRQILFCSKSFQLVHQADAKAFQSMH